ncbi:MAG: Carbon starvation protein A [Verrucomicrobia subdivision 3 bacterium]|nr:Carbon starvation protein A [Limisphaerales bacterium]MCS1417722.1 Carbon starvation protein A [Limisphaerales bacterium]
MVPLLIALMAGVGFVVAYHTYGRWLGGKIFALSAKAVCPSYRLQDGADYVPTSKGIVFGHHFTSIAGTGPIVGPAIAIMWGWLPALLWVVFGAIFIGAVHDFGALVVSLRNNGQTVGDIAGRVLNRRVRLLFLLVLVMSLTIVLAIFGLVIASVFRLYPAAIFSCVVQIPLAIGIGVWLHRKGASILVPSLVVLALMYLTVFFGDRGLLGAFNHALAGWSSWTWVLVLLFYSYGASVLPVWTLLQPRDYINSLQLISALALIVLGLMASAFFGGAPLADSSRPDLSMAAPLINLDPKGAPLIFPFLFITVACGAISGFHCLVSSGTSSKQLMKEPDARFVGYGGMLTEGFLATLVILACGAGLGLGLAVEGQMLTGAEAWNNRYGSWGAAGSLGAKVSAFVFGAANFLQALGLSSTASIALMGVLVASFAGTTLDTACRLQRYVVQELAATLSPGAGGLEGQKAGGLLRWLQNKHGATIFAVMIAAGLSAVPPAGKAWSVANAGTGGLLLWPLFGATNQLLAGLAFLVIVFYLWRRDRPVWFILLPMIFMMIMPFWAMVWQVFIGSSDNSSWVSQGKVLLSAIGLATILLELWMIVEAVRMFPKVKGVIEETAMGLDGGAVVDTAKA